MKSLIALSIAGFAIALSGCQPGAGSQTSPSTPNAPTSRFSYEPARVEGVRHVPARVEIKQEEYQCRMGAGMHVCTRDKRIHHPAGVKVDLRLVAAPDTVVGFFDTDLRPDLEGATGQIACVDLITGAFGRVVAGVDLAGENGQCRAQVQARDIPPDRTVRL